MHYCVYVFIPASGDIDGRVAVAMEPFADYLEVPEYKSYPCDGEIRAMAENRKIDVTNLTKLAANMEAWNGRMGGVDDRGLFFLSTFNPNAKFDWYEIGGRWDGVIPGNVATTESLLKRKNLEKLSPAAFVTPEGAWHECETFIFEDWGKWRAETKSKAAWLKEFRSALEKHPESRVACVDMHS